MFSIEVLDIFWIISNLESNLAGTTNSAPVSQVIMLRYVEGFRKFSKLILVIRERVRF